MDTRILIWNSGDGPIYYDVSDNELLLGASIDVLQLMMDAGYFHEPRPLEEDITYKSYQNKIEVLKLAFGECEEEAFEQANITIDHCERIIRTKETTYKRLKEEWDKINHILSNDDGYAATMYLTERLIDGDELMIITPDKCRVPENKYAKA